MLRRRVDELTAQLADASRRLAPQDVDSLAQGDDAVYITISLPTGDKWFDTTWRRIFRAILPLTFGVGAGESDIKSAIKNIIWPKDYGDVISDDYTKVMNQMVPLGMIEARPHPSLPAVSLWFATPYGQTVGSRMAALQRKEDEMPF